MHMAQMFKNMMSWCLIPISEAHAFGGNVRVMQFYIGDEPDAHFASNIGSNMIRTRLESPDEAEMHSILLDSGADTSVFPATMAELGCPSVAPPSLLRDAQGNTIPLHGMRDVEIHLMDMQGRAATIEESVALSDQISQPILCFGRLLESGWSVDGRQQTLTHGSMSIPIEMQQRSMTPRGWIRAVKEEPAILEPLCCIRNVRAEIFNELADLRIGWNLSPEGVGSGKHFANCFQDPMLPCPTMSGRKFRTTLVKHEEQWLVMELCEPLDLIIDLSAEFYGFDGGRLVVTVITTAEHPPHVMGFRLLDDNEDTQPALQVEQRPHADVAAPLAPEDEVAGVDIDVEPHDAGQDIQGQLVVSPERGDHMVVYGVELYRETTLKVERSLCLLQSFTSFTVWIPRHDALRGCGNTRNVWSYRLFWQLQEKQRQSNSANPILRSWQNLQMRKRSSFHNSTHLPYQEWCPHCVAFRARPDRHQRDGSVKDSGIPTVSFDFAYTKAVEPGGQAQETSAVIALVLVDSSTNFTGCMPISKKE